MHNITYFGGYAAILSGNVCLYSSFIFVTRLYIQAAFHQKNHAQVGVGQTNIDIGTNKHIHMLIFPQKQFQENSLWVAVGWV